MLYSSQIERKAKKDVAKENGEHVIAQAKGMHADDWDDKWTNVLEEIDRSRVRGLRTIFARKDSRNGKLILACPIDDDGFFDIVRRYAKSLKAGLVRIDDVDGDLILVFKKADGSEVKTTIRYGEMLNHNFETVSNPNEKLMYTGGDSEDYQGYKASQQFGDDEKVYPMFRLGEDCKAWERADSLERIFAKETRDSFGDIYVDDGTLNIHISIGWNDVQTLNVVIPVSEANEGRIVYKLWNATNDYKQLDALVKYTNVRYRKYGPYQRVALIVENVEALRNFVYKRLEKNVEGTRIPKLTSKAQEEFDRESMREDY